MSGAKVVISVLIFPAIITLVEFPCFAAVPAAFAGILADVDIPGTYHFGLILLFLLFYLLDELLVFGVAVYRMNVWISSPKFTKSITLIERLILIGLSIYYLQNIL